jgi:3-carboxy-cis,cis-muconate cycloisomerase
MPHKRNPTAAATALAAATIAPNLLATILAAQVQEHERALGGWQAEWPTFPALALVTSGAVNAIADIAQGLEVDSERMRINLDETHGLIMAEAVSLALGAKVGKSEANKLVEEASRKALAAKCSLHDVLGEDDRVKLASSPSCSSRRPIRARRRPSSTAPSARCRTAPASADNPSRGRDHA